MPIQVVTTDDLERMRKLLIEDIKSIIQRPEAPPKYIRSGEVRKLLGNISVGSLHNLRINGILHPIRLDESTKIWYYNSDEIYSLLKGGNDK